MKYHGDNPTFFELVLEDSLIKKPHFLDSFDLFFDWSPIAHEIKKLVKKSGYRAVGRPAYDALKMLKVLLIQQWYSLSDPEIEEMLYDRMSFMRFTGFTPEYGIPDHSTISRFRTFLSEKNRLEKLFALINAQLEAKNFFVKKGVIVDATVIESSRHPQKTIEVMADDRQEDETVVADTESPSSCEITYSDDTEAAWLKKGNKSYYGYKLHHGVEEERGFIVGLVVTGANRSDTGQLENVIERCGIPALSRCYADKGYASESNRQALRHARIKNGIMYKKVKGQDINPWATRFNKLISKVRYKVEQSFAILKQHYGFTRMRYVGIEKCTAECYLKAMAFNLKKAALLCG